MPGSVNVCVGDRETGKTTWLYHIFREEIKRGARILILDSATEHVQKSLLEKIYAEKGWDMIRIGSCEKDLIVFPQADRKAYPYEIIRAQSARVYLCDVSFYLERGYDFEPGILREKERLLYKRLSMQFIELLRDRIDIILMDEIELPSGCGLLFREIVDRGIRLYMTLHSGESLCHLKDFVKIERISLNESGFL